MIRRRIHYHPGQQVTLKSSAFVYNYNKRNFLQETKLLSAHQKLSLRHLLDHQQPCSVDTNQAQANMLLKLLHLPPEPAAVPPELLHNLLKRELVLPPLKTEPDHLLLVLHLIMQTRHNAAQCVELPVQDVRPLGCDVQLLSYLPQRRALEAVELRKLLL